MPKRKFVLQRKASESERRSLKNRCGFGELECQAQAIGGEMGRSASTDQLILWLYVGSIGKVKTIARHLLGIRL